MSARRWLSTGAGERAASEAAQRTEDRGLLRVYAILRVLVGLAICVGGLFVRAKEPDTRLWLIIVATAWLPVSLAVLIATFRTRSRILLILGPLADLVMLATAQGLLHQGIGLTACYPIIAAFAAYTTYPALPTWALGGFTLGLILIVQSQLPRAQRFTAPRFGLFAALVIGVLLIVERATARSRGAEERFARAKTRADAVLAAVASAVVVTDSQSRVITANPAADHVLGNSEPLPGQLCSAALGLHIGDRRLDCSTGCQLLAMRSDDASAAFPTTEFADADGSLLDFEAWRPGRDGGRQPLLVSVNTLPAADGPEIEVVHSIRDITRLRQADEAKTLFLATASHELKTPLTVINGFAKTLTTRSLTPEKQREALAAIRRRGEELARVVDRLLLTSRIEAGRAEVAQSMVDLIPLVYERAATLADANDRHIEVDLPDDLPAVLGDQSAIVTVLDHLLDNAVKYSPDGDMVEVRAVVERSDSRDFAANAVAGSSVVLEVVDSGVGMTPEIAQHCFDKFWQGDPSGTRRFGGTGIGLYIARSLMEAMGGSISVTSSPGEGSTFALRLVAAEAVPAIPPPANGESVSGPPSQLRRRPRLPRLGRTPESDSERAGRD